MTGEPLAVDLINTRLRLPDIGWVDVLDSLAGLQHWSELQADRLTTDPGALTEGDRVEIRKLREHLTAAVHQARHRAVPPATSLRGINRALKASAQTMQLTWHTDRLVQETSYTRGPGGALLSQLARAGADLLTDPQVTSVRNCAMADCVALFYSTNPRRKWCVDAICGNRARVARHYRRHRQGAKQVR